MRTRLEAAIGRFARIIVRHAYAALGAVALLLALGATQLPNIELRVSTDEFLRETDPARVSYMKFLERFGRDDIIVIAIEPREVFNFEFLEKLRKLHREIEDTLPHLREVQSLINARETRAEGDTLVVGEFLQEWPETEAELASLRARALKNPFYESLLLSQSAQFTTVSVTLEPFADRIDEEAALEGFDDTPADADTQPERITGLLELEIVAKLNEILERYEGPDFRIYAGGSPVMNAAMSGAIIRDISLFMLLSITVIAIALAIVFRRTLGVIVPLTISIGSLFGTAALMGTFHIPAMPISQIVPSFLLSVGVGGTVHLLVIFQQQLANGVSREDAIAQAFEHSGLPIIMTSLTTAGGLISFLTAELLPIAVFGVVAPLGILVTLIMTLVMTPALIAVLPLRFDRYNQTRVPATRQSLAAVGDFATRNPGIVLGGSFLLLLISVTGMLRLQVSFNPVAWFPEDMPAVIAIDKLDSEFGGTLALELLIDSGVADGLKEPEILQRIDRARHTLEGLQVDGVVVGKSLSLVDIVKETHQALHGADASAYTIPNNRELLAQELFLFETSGSDDLETFVDSEFRISRFTLRIPNADGAQYAAIGDEANRVLDEVLEGHATTTQTGLALMMGRSFVATVETLIRSYGVALAIITPLMMLVLGSARLGLIAMIPNLFPIVLTLGLMGWLGIPMEMFTLLLGSIALGLAVDDTIHFMHGFRRNYSQKPDVAAAVRDTLRTTGQALLFTTIVLSCGFSLYMLSDLINLTNFGGLTTFAIITAFAADVLLAPALMKVMTRFSSIRSDVQSAT